MGFAILTSQPLLDTHQHNLFGVLLLGLHVHTSGSIHNRTQWPVFHMPAHKQENGYHVSFIILTGESIHISRIQRHPDDIRRA